MTWSFKIKIQIYSIYENNYMIWGSSSITFSPLPLSMMPKCVPLGQPFVTLPTTSPVTPLFGPNPAATITYQQYSKHAAISLSSMPVYASFLVPRMPSSGLTPSPLGGTVGWMLQETIPVSSIINKRPKQAFP